MAGLPKAPATAADLYTESAAAMQRYEEASTDYTKHSKAMESLLAEAKRVHTTKVVAAQRGLVLEAEMSYVMRGWRRDGAVVQKVVDSEMKTTGLRMGYLWRQRPMAA